MRYISIVLMLFIACSLFSLSKSESKYLEANGYMKTKQYERALALYDESIAAEGDFAPAWQMKYIIFDKLGKTGDADECLDKMLGIRKKNMPDARLNAPYIKASGLANMGENEKALAQFDLALAKDLGRYAVLALHEKGDLLLALSRFADGISSYEKSLAIDSQNKLAWYNKGFAEAQLSQYDKSLASFEKAIAIDDRDAGLWQNKGVVLVLLKRFADSLPAFDASLALNAKNPTVWEWKGKAFEGLGKKDEADKAYAKAKELKGK